MNTTCTVTTRTVETRAVRAASVLATTFLLIAVLLPARPALADDPVDIWFPVRAPYEYTDTWGDARSGGRTHEGTDIMSDQMNQVLAANAGVIEKANGEDCAVGEECSSFYLLVNGDDGHSYFYIHLNNDTPGRPEGCDGKGGADNAFSPRLVDILREEGTLAGVRVERGEHIAYVGSSGNAGCGVDHLHFEIWHGHDWGSPKINPYRSLQAAEDAGRVSGENDDTSPEGADGGGANGAPAQSEEPDGGSDSDAGEDADDGDPEDDGADARRTRRTPPPPGPHGRVAGSNRILTSVALSKHGFDTADTVVLAPANYHPEALVAAPLAAAKEGPVLLAWAAPGKDALPDEVAAEIRRLGASRAVLVGSPDRLSSNVKDQLISKAGLSRKHIRRIAGADRYAVAANVAREIMAIRGTSVSPLLALGEHEVESRSWPDALGASVVASSEHVPVLLVRPYKLPGAVKQVLAGDGIGEVRIVGGEGAISRGVAHEVRDLGLRHRRLAGSTRFGTSVALAGELRDRADGDRAYLATGHNFPDAIAAGPVVAERGGVLLMVDGRDPEQATEVWDWLRDSADDVDRTDAVGGAGVVSDGVLDKAAAYAHWHR